MSKILITGGAGFIGSSLAVALLNQGHKIAIIDDLSSGKKSYVPAAAKFYKLSILNKKLFKIIAEFEPDFVYHLAAQIDVRISVKDPKLDNQINVVGGLQVLQACLKNKVKKIIFSSTGGAIYGDADVVPTPETYLPNPLSPYGIHKLTFEKYLRYYHEVFGQSFITLRFANVYGPKQYKGGEAGVVAIFCNQAVNDQALTLNGDGSQTRDFVYVDDVVSALIAAKSSDYVGEINIGSRQESKITDIIKALDQAAGKQLTIEHRPAALGEQQRSFLDVNLAKQILHWEPQVNLITGINKTYNWSKNNL